MCLYVGKVELQLTSTTLCKFVPAGLVYYFFINTEECRNSHAFCTQIHLALYIHPECGQTTLDKYGVILPLPDISSW